MSVKYRIKLKDSPNTTALEASDVDVTDYDWDYNDLDVNATGVFDVINGDKSISVTFTAYVSYEHISLDVVPDGEPTYVPFGSTDVMYDDGSGYVENIDIRDAIEIEWQELYADIDDSEDLYLEQASEILGCTDEELESFLDKTVKKSGFVYNKVVRSLENSLISDNRYIDEVYDRYKEVDY